MISHHTLGTSLALALALAVPGQDRTTSIPTEVMVTIGQVLPERSSAGAAFVSDVYDPNLSISAECTIEVIIVWEGAGYKNSLGYFTYEEAQGGGVNILSADLIEPNVSFPRGGSLQIGDTYTLKGADGLPRTFQPGERVGFFLVANGYSSSHQVRNWSYSYPNVPSTAAWRNRRIGLGCYSSVDFLNHEWSLGAPDRARHLAMIRMGGIAGFLGGEDFMLCGFEDLDRTRNSDEDFNDCVFIVTASPFSAISGTDVMGFQPGDPDGDGVAGTEDQFPEDPDRAYSTSYPSAGLGVVAFEDNYPDLGDADYNDAVIAYEYELVSNADGLVVDVVGSFFLVARGASYDAGFGVHIPSLPDDAAGTLRIERFLGGEGTRVRQTETDMSVSDLIHTDQRRIMNLFPSTTLALPGPGGQGFANTLHDASSVAPGAARFHLHLTTPVDPTVLGPAPFDLFLYMNRYGNGIWDIHLPGHAAFADRSTHLPAEDDGTPFVDDNGFPWAIDITTSWRFPMERSHIERGYPGFRSWRQSGGAQQRDWYMSPELEGGDVSSALDELLVTIDWQLKVPR